MQRRKGLNGKIVSWNKSAERIFGYSRKKHWLSISIMPRPTQRNAEISELIKRGERPITRPFAKQRAEDY
jgi:PAS domain S-box-containing protein